MASTESRIRVWQEQCLSINTVYGKDLKMSRSQISHTNLDTRVCGLDSLGRLLNDISPAIILGGALALLMGTEVFAQVDGVDKIIKGVSDSVLPNVKYGTGVVSGTLGLGIAIAGLLKTSPRMLIAGASLAIIPATLWDSVVGGAATILIP